MNKIHNNLTIENLIKTDWIKQFDIDQQFQIEEGIKNEVDILIYAKTDFDSEQMREIRAGLQDNLDVSIYATPEYN